MWYYYSWHTISTTEVQQNWSFLDLPVSALTAPRVLQQLQLQPAGSTDPAFIFIAPSQQVRNSKCKEVAWSTSPFPLHPISEPDKKNTSIQIQFVWTEEVRVLSKYIHLPPNLWVCSMCGHHIWRQSCKHLGITLENIIIIHSSVIPQNNL